MQNGSGWGRDRQHYGVHDAVGNVDKLNPKIANLFYLPRFDRNEFGLVKQAMLLQLAFNQPKRISGPVNRDMHQRR